MGKTCMDTTQLFHVDAFSRRPFAGNPAVVCLLKKRYQDNVLQSIASEMNLSETAFVQKNERKPIEEEERFSLRWFTPTTEVNLCGHATLATAAVLFYDVKVSATEISFETRSGKLTARLENDGILLNLPSNRTTPVTPDKELLEAVEINEFESAYFSKKTGDLLICLEDEETLRNLKPDFSRMKSLRTAGEMQAIIVTSKGHPPYDFVSRCFAPWVGVDEDPVTGAAHTILGPYWSRILRKKKMLAYQASKRGGELTVKLLAPNRVGLIGNAVIVSKGELFLPQEKLS